MKENTIVRAITVVMIDVKPGARNLMQQLLRQGLTITDANTYRIIQNYVETCANLHKAGKASGREFNWYKNEAYRMIECYAEVIDRSKLRILFLN